MPEPRKVSQYRVIASPLDAAAAAGAGVGVAAGAVVGAAAGAAGAAGAAVGAAVGAAAGWEPQAAKATVTANDPASD